VVKVRCVKCAALIDGAQWAVPDPRGEVVAFLRPYRDAKRIKALLQGREMIEASGEITWVQFNGPMSF
jgi:hypothetical protein